MNIKKLVLLMLILAILAQLASTQVYAVELPADDNAMWFEPQIVDLTVVDTPVGYKFNVTLWAKSSLVTKGWQFWLVYAKAYINLTRVGYTAGGKSQFYQNITTMPVSPAFKTYNDTHNRLDFGEAWLMGDKRSPGYGSLCWLEFEIVAEPSEYVEILLDIKWAYDLSPSPQTYLFYEDGTKKPLTVYNGSIVIPEFSSLLMLTALFTSTIPIALYSRRQRKKQ